MWRWFRTRSQAAERQPVARQARRRSVLALERLEDRKLLTIKFVFDYSLDTAGFFNSDRKAILELAGRMLGDRLDDSLAAIKPTGSNTWIAKFTNPATGNLKTISNLKINSNEILVFAGGRNLPAGTGAIGGSRGFSASGTAAWGDLVETRGQSGVKNGSDVAPWGGSITFDTVGVNWHTGATTSGLSSSEHDLLSTAIHELGHVLGLGTSQSWRRWIANGKFTGTNAKAAHGGSAVPLDGGKDHWENGTTSDDIEVAMDPSLSGDTRKLFSALDFAAMKDIGWKVSKVDDTIYRARHELTYIPSTNHGVDGLTLDDIQSSKDVNLYRLYIGAGADVEISVWAQSKGTRIDTYLRLFDASGKELKKADTVGVGRTDTLTYHVGRSDYYFVGVSTSANKTYNPRQPSSGPGGPTGSYTLAISAED